MVNATKERQAWCCLQVKLCDPCLSALYVPWCEKALYKYSAFPFLSFPFLYKGHQLSALTELLFGVPHGSVLGPLLFLLYTAELFDVIAHSGLVGHSYDDNTQSLLRLRPRLHRLLLSVSSRASSGSMQQPARD